MYFIYKKNLKKMWMRVTLARLSLLPRFPHEMGRQMCGQNIRKSAEFQREFYFGQKGHVY